MSGITYTWMPSCTPRTSIDAALQELESVHEGIVLAGDFKAIWKSEDIFWAGAHRSLSRWDSWHTQDQMGFSLKDPVEKIRKLLEKNPQNDFTFCIISKGHIFIKENSSTINFSSREDLVTTWPLYNPDGCAPPKVTTSLCLEKDQTLLRDIIPDLFEQIGARASLTRESKHLCIDGKDAVAPVDMVSVRWN